MALVLVVAGTLVVRNVKLKNVSFHQIPKSKEDNELLENLNKT